MRRAAVVVAMVIAHAARADVEVVRLMYTAPDGCPDLSAVMAQIVERTALVKFEDKAPRTFAITITQTPDGFAGTLSVDASADKVLAAKRCDDLVEALALVTALAIDPAATITPKPKPKPLPPPPPPPPRPRVPIFYDAMAGGLVDAGVTPDPMLAGVIQARASRKWLAVELGVLAGHDSADAGEGEATFLWLIAQPAVCVTTRALMTELAGCGDVEVGVVRAGGQGIINGRALDRLWWSAGVHGEVRWPQDSRAFGQLQVGVEVPFLRDRYRFNPGILIHETAAVTGWLGVGVGLRFR